MRGRPARYLEPERKSLPPLAGVERTVTFVAFSSTTFVSWQSTMNSLTAEGAVLLAGEILRAAPPPFAFHGNGG